MPPERQYSILPEANMKRNKRNFIIPVFLPFTGCTNRCMYCNQRALHPEAENPNPEMIKEKICRYLSTIGRKKEDSDIEVAFYGGTFTNISNERQRELLNALSEFIECKKIDGIRFSTRPDNLDSAMLEYYKKSGVTTIEIGAQSFRDEVLRFVRRNHSSEDIRDSVILLQTYGFRTSLHLMFGLPLSGYEDDIYSIEETIRLKPDFVRLHPTLVLRDTELETLYKSGRYEPLSLKDTLRILRYALRRFRESGINVIRVGLHNDDNLVNPGTLIAGPFHPSLRQIAENSSD